MNKIIASLKEALRHARCVNRHVEKHITTKIGDDLWETTCMRCGHSWTEEYQDEALKVIRPVKWG